jgi:thiol-disulfide isomerase/thioredoxin
MLSDVSSSLVAAQWALLLGLAVLVIVMYRQLAYLLQVGRAIAGSGGLEIGEHAPEFDYLAPAPEDGQWERRAFALDGRPTLLMFTHPGCGSCELALENLQRVVENSQVPVRALAVTDAELEILDASDMRRRVPIELAKVDRKITTKLYRTYRTPYVYGVDSSGAVRTRGGGVTAKEIRKMLRQVARVH